MNKLHRPDNKLTLSTIRPLNMEAFTLRISLGILCLVTKYLSVKDSDQLYSYV